VIYVARNSEEPKNQYRVVNDLGQQVYFAAEGWIRFQMMKWNVFIIQAYCHNDHRVVWTQNEYIYNFYKYVSNWDLV